MLCSILILSVVCIVEALPASPCPEIYGYEKNEYGQTKGIIAILAPRRYSLVQIVAVLSSPVPVSNDELGELTLKGGKKAATEATQYVLQGRRHVLQFLITFPPGKPIPTLYSITVNGLDFCTAPAFPDDSRARITLHSYLTTGVNAPPTQDFGLVTGFFPDGSKPPTQETLQLKDDNYLKDISKQLSILVDIQKQRLSVEKELLSLTQQRHHSYKIYFKD